MTNSIQELNIYSRVKYTKILNRIQLVDIQDILRAVGQNPDLADVYLQYSDGNTRRLEHLITHSISIARFNDKAEVDSAVIQETSKLLMA